MPIVDLLMLEGVVLYGYICVLQLVADPQNFQAAGRELLEWCSDTRAFSPKFEPYLMECLEVSWLLAY